MKFTMYHGVYVGVKYTSVSAAGHCAQQLLCHMGKWLYLRQFSSMDITCDLIVQLLSIFLSEANAS